MGRLTTHVLDTVSGMPASGLQVTLWAISPEGDRRRLVEARTNQRMIERAQKVVVVADGSKLGQVTMAKMADIGEVDLLITDNQTPSSFELSFSVRVAVCFFLHWVEV